MTGLRILATVATFIALAAFGAALGDFASDPSPLGAAGLLVILAAMAMALARLYGPAGVTALRPGDPMGADGATAPPEESRRPGWRAAVAERLPRTQAPAATDAGTGSTARAVKRPAARASRRRQRASAVEESWTTPPEGRAQRPRLRRAREPDARIDLNRASAADIATLPGVGIASGRRIVAERQANGPYATVSDLARVDGFNPERIRRLADHARV